MSEIEWKDPPHPARKVIAVAIDWDTWDTLDGILKDSGEASSTFLERWLRAGIAHEARMKDLF